jgi:hypothetical protein
MSSKYNIVGSVQSGVRNVFAGATVYTLAAPIDPFVGTVRLAISGSAGTNPTTWIVRIQQSIWSEEWYGETYGGSSVALVLNDIFFIAGGAITITLENTATSDTAVTVEASLFAEVNSPTAVENAAQVRTNLAVELARIDDNITSRLSTLGTNAPANWINAAAIAASALNGKGNWNIGKTGYSLTATTGLGNQTANITGNLTGSVGSVTGAVTVGTNNDKTGYTLVDVSGPRAITRTFQTSTGDKIPGVRMSLVGIANKVSDSGSNGIAQIKTDNGTYTLRVVVPTGYQDVPDSSVTISGSDSTATIVLSPVPLPTADAPLCAVTINITNQFGQPLAGATVETKFIRFNSGPTSLPIVLSPPQVLTSDVNGIVSINLYRSADYTINIFSTNSFKSKQVTIPNLASFLISESA